MSAKVLDHAPKKLPGEGFKTSLAATHQDEAVKAKVEKHFKPAK